MKQFPCVCLALLVAAQFGCGGDEKTVTDSAGNEAKTKQDSDDKTITVTGPEGQRLEVATDPDGEVSLPDSWPADVPIYPDAAVKTAATTPVGNIVMLESSAAVKDVVAFYADKLADLGWQSTLGLDQSDGRMMQLQKGDSHATVVVSYKDGKTEIYLTVATVGAKP